LLIVKLNTLEEPQEQSTVIIITFRYYGTFSFHVISEPLQFLFLRIFEKQGLSKDESLLLAFTSGDEDINLCRFKLESCFWDVCWWLRLRLLLIF